MTKPHPRLYVAWIDPDGRYLIYHCDSGDDQTISHDLGLSRFGWHEKMDGNGGWVFRLKDGVAIETAVACMKEYKRVNYETKQTAVCRVKCPECGQPVEVIAQSLNYLWNEERQVFEHVDFSGHALGRCCDLHFSDWDGGTKTIVIGTGNKSGKTYRGKAIKPVKDNTP